MELQFLTFDRIQNEAMNFTLSTSSNSYINSYPEFIRHFELIKGDINKHDLIISSHFVYGWMPTILDINLIDIDKKLKLFNSAKSGHVLKNEELIDLKECINNSMVGLSKLLHFMNPTTYAIWDSRIFRFTTGKEKSTYGIDRPQLYLDYLEKLREIVSNPGFSSIHEKIQETIKYNISPFRIVDIIIFEADKRKNAT